MEIKMEKLITGYKRQKESGNVLFLILIAVALFAALSYAVTQSSRSGGGDAAGETSLVNSAQITQYPAAVRTSLIRMLVNGSATVDQLEFDPPADFVGGSEAVEVFHPTGGGATFVTAPPDLMFTSASGTWLFNSAYQITNIGTTVAADTGNDIIAFLPGLALNVCRRLNEELGIGSTGIADDDDGNGVPDAGIAITDIPVAADNQDNGNQGINGGGGYVAANVIDGPDFVGQPFGCADFDDATAGTADGDLIYYHVLVER
jgi:hypothetical protein